MPETRPDDPYANEDEEPLEGDALDLEALKIRQDTDGLLTLAKAYRSGRGVPRDLKKCYEVYKAAADLGSAEGDYAVALFHLTGGVIAQDLKEGVTRLRAAAEKGSVPAKVYLGNLYELGIHYKADKEKADVWYRNAARGAGVETDEELAELGCVRFVLEIVEHDDVDEAEKQRLIQRARAHGYQLKMRDGSSPDMGGDRPTLAHALAAQSVTPVLKEPTPRAAKTKLGDPAADTVKVPAQGPSRASIALGAFGFALLWVLAGTGAGYAAMHGARELLAHGTRLPVLGDRLQYVFPIVVTVFGILPAGLPYRFGAWLKALVVGAAAGGAGWVAWGTGLAAVHASRFMQTGAFALVGFLLGLLAFGLAGGTKKQPRRARR